MMTARKEGTPTGKRRVKERRVILESFNSRVS